MAKPQTAWFYVSIEGVAQARRPVVDDHLIDEVGDQAAEEP